MFRKVTLLIALLGLSGSIQADPEFEKWLKQYKKEFQTFVDEHDKEFAKFLKENWVETEVKPEEKRDSVPKPVSIPETKPKPLPKVDPNKKPEPIPEIVVAPKPVPKPVVKPEPKPVVQPKPKPPVLVAKPEDKPKPVIKPEPDKKTEPKPVVKLPVEVAKPKPVIKPEPKPVLPPVLPPVIKPVKKPFDYVKRGEASVTIKMLGQALNMPKLNIKSLSLRKVDSNSVSDAWLTMAKTKFKSQVSALQQAGKDLALDDWGQALLTHAYLTQGLRLSKNELQLYSWFYLVKQGFNSRVAYSDQNVFLMLQVEQKLFGQKYFNLKEGKYYFVDLGQKRPVNVGRVYTYNKQHASASEKVNIDLSTAPKHGKSDSKRTLTTQFNNRTINVTTAYNREYIEYLDHYPQLSMEYYFRAELPTETKQALLNQLKPHIKDLNEQAALNVLLRFVQTSLEYQTDQQQFNYENYLFAGETLHYPYADCEDRAVLYAYLVQNLLGNEVVGLQYDGHIATAVAINTDIPGDKFKINGKAYLVADPTFINANVGRTMTGYEKQSPKVITF